MGEIKTSNGIRENILSFFDRPQVQKDEILAVPGVSIGIEQVSNPQLGIGGAYGTWGKSYDNFALQGFVEERLGEPLNEGNRLELAALGFTNRHHVPVLPREEEIELEVEVGERFLRAATQAIGWEPGEVDAVIIGVSGPVVEDYTERIARRAGIPEQALKISVHKACDGSVGALHLALNPEHEINSQQGRNIAAELFGKKVLVGGIEGLSRLMKGSRDLNALQLFGNGAGVIGVIPGKTIQFLVGKVHEVFDEQGVLAFRMLYPHSRQRVEGRSLVEVSLAGENHIRIAGLMHEPEGDKPVDMAGPMGMVKLFVRTGVQVVQDVYQAYQSLMKELGTSEKTLSTTIVHHANLKINQLKEKFLNQEGIHIQMPWVISEFGNVSAASNMIAFLRQLPGLHPGDHILFDGFGAGTYYDVLAVALGSPEAQPGQA